MRISDWSSDVCSSDLLSPRFIPNLTISVDYFNINIANSIGTISQQQIINLCQQGNQSLCGIIVRDSTTGLITQISASQLNFTRLSTRGLDVALIYRVPLGDRRASCSERVCQYE